MQIHTIRTFATSRLFKGADLKSVRTKSVIIQ